MPSPHQVLLLWCLLQGLQEGQGLRTELLVAAGASSGPCGAAPSLTSRCETGRWVCALRLSRGALCTEVLSAAPKRCPFRALGLTVSGWWRLPPTPAPAAAVADRLRAACVPWPPALGRSPGCSSRSFGRWAPRRTTSRRATRGSGSASRGRHGGGGGGRWVAWRAARTPGVSHGRGTCRPGRPGRWVFAEPRQDGLGGGRRMGGSRWGVATLHLGAPALSFFLSFFLFVCLFVTLPCL